MAGSESVAAMWSAFEAARPDLLDGDAARSAWHFCDNETDANELAELVLAGAKRATAGLVSSYAAEGEPVPNIGDLSVITDWDGRARCVIRTTAVEIVPFGAVTAEFAAVEGEGDGSLEYWRHAHEAAFSRELAGSAYTLGPDTPVVCERFEVVFVTHAEPSL